MFDFPYEAQGYPYYDMRAPRAYVRLLHAVPNAPPVDVYANNNLIARNLAYRNFTQYLQVVPGTYEVRVFAAGQTANPVLVTSVTVADGSIQTIAATGLLPNISPLTVAEPITPIPPGRLFLRFVHLSPNAPAVDVALPDGSRLFRDVTFREITDYIPVRPGNYTILLKAAGTDTNVLYVPNIVLRPNRFITIYAVGLAGGTPPLQVLIPLDGNSYLKF